MTKTALITGASSGFGLACAERLAADGWQLVLAARRLDRLHQLAQRLADKTQVHCLQLDVREREQVQQQLSRLPAEFAKVELLVNNAGLALGLSPAQQADLDDWDVMVDTNIKGLTYVTRALLPGMVACKKGHVINIGSIAGSYAYPGGNAYGATKAFVAQFSRNLRADLLGSGVRVTNIEPGLAETEFSLVRFHGDKHQAEQVYAGTQPLQAKDIAEAVVWAAAQPPHVNINSIELMPSCQAHAPLAIHRE